MEWLPVLDPYLGGYYKGFDRDSVYEFRRGTDGEIMRFKMADQNPHFNIAALWWRPIPDAAKGEPQ